MALQPEWGRIQAAIEQALVDVPSVLQRSAVAIPAPANANENTLATITVPANAMGADGRLRVWALLTCTNNANAKTVRFRFGGAILVSENLANAAVLGILAEIANRGAANSQLGMGWRLAMFGVATAATPGAIDTTAARDVTITAQKANGADALTLESYAVELVP